MLTCTFFGHRDVEKEIEPTLRETLVDLIQNKNVRNFYVGNHGRYDYMVKELLIEGKGFDVIFADSERALPWYSQ